MVGVKRDSIIVCSSEWMRTGSMSFVSMDDEMEEKNPVRTQSSLSALHANDLLSNLDQTKKKESVCWVCSTLKRVKERRDKAGAISAPTLARFCSNLVPI